MLLKTEIKDFVKKVLMIGILLSLFVNLLVTYFTNIDSTSVSAQDTNEQTFKKVNSGYLGTTGVALSLNIGTKFKSAKDTPVSLTTEVLPISFILANKTVSRDKIVTANMIGLNEYLNVVRTDVNKLLDQASDRESMLESYLDQLKYRYTNTTEQINTLNQQAAQLNTVVASSNQKIEALKTTLTSSYKSLDYDKTQATLDEYLVEKDKNTYATTYLVFVSKFIQSYTLLNTYNKVLLDTLINNKEALVKNVTVVLPDSGTNLMKKFNLVKTEAEFKSGTQN
ncbi:MAG: hypothetical protein PHZ26_00475 [Candidatus Gracilibacteria bacterium]|nr:hypothetical protein [Candidatus Gracilibacteria bacterium]MDD2908212.1 hypothetical protein [Candidatus Gracilibacteria bacterium]